MLIMKMKTIDDIKKNVEEIVKNYPVSKVTLFGSRARGDNRPDSDVDLLCEFYSEKVGLIMLCTIKQALEEKIGLSVDLIHAPIPKTSILEIDKEIPIYEAQR